jgi:hypothetical protein
MYAGVPIAIPPDVIPIPHRRAQRFRDSEVRDERVRPDREDIAGLCPGTSRLAMRIGQRSDDVVQNRTTSRTGSRPRRARAARSDSPSMKGIV